MFERLRANRCEECISDLRFDAMLVCELDEHELRAIDRHLADCAACRAQLAALQRDRERFLASAEGSCSGPRVSVVRAKSSGHGRALAIASAVLALGLFVVSYEAPSPERIKGGTSLGFYIKRGDAIQRGSDAHLQPGDRVRFTYSADRARYLAIVSIDAARATSVYFEDQGQAVFIDAASDAPLPTAIELDDTLGDERVYAVFCDAPFAISSLLESGAEQAPLLPYPECQVEVVVWHKRATER